MRLLLALVTGLSLLFCASSARAQVVGAEPLDPPSLLAGAVVPDEFVAETAFDDLMAPASIAFSPDGRVFVGQLDGVIKVYDDLQDTTGSVYADLSENVAFHGDRGLIGMTLDPAFTSGRPYLYALYTYDAAIGGTAPRWNDVCPDPPGADRDGCVVSGRLSKVLPDGSEQPLITNEWCQQYSSHSVGDVKFGPDGALYVTGGDGASYTFADYGQDGSPVNPCGDPPAGVGGAMYPPTAEGGALRSQDARTTGDPTGLSGAMLRIDPDTGDPLPDNPGTGTKNERRIIAYGLRNPFRFAFRPGTTDAYIGDVGWLAWEEVNRMPDASKVRNYGWPCYEGNSRQAGYEAIGLNVCQNLYAEGSAAVERPLYTYNHNAKVAGEACAIGSSSTSGIAFYQGVTYPSAYNGALFFADYARNCIWVMFPDANGVPNPDTRQVFVDGARTPVDLEIGPDGELYYADVAGGTIQRVRSINPNQAPTAALEATPRSGNAPLTVHFDATGSTDPNEDELDYAWDLDDDGVYDDSTDATPTRTYTQDGNITVRLRVTDPSGASDTEQTELTVGTLPTVAITSPAVSSSYTVGETVSFSGTATAPDGSPIPSDRLTWTLDLNHCSAINESSCHVHHIQNYVGVRSGTFKYPDHEYPSHITLSLTAQLPSGLRGKASLRIDPKTTDLRIESVPAGMTVAVGGEASTTPFTRRVARGSTVGVAAPPSQFLQGSSYGFTSWSDGGQSTHQFTAPDTASTYTVRYAQAQCPNPTGLVGAWGFDEPSGAVAYDASGRGNHGEVFGPDRSPDGRFGSALQFDGVDDFVSVDDSASLDLEGGMTLEAWVNPTQLGTSWRTAMMKEAGGDLAYALYAHNGTGPSGHVTTSGEYNTVGERLVPNRWTHLTATYDGTNLRLYVDGVLVSTRVAGRAISVSNGALQIGGNTVWSEWFAGRLDDLRVYNRALSATEISADMARPVTCAAVPDAPGLGISPTSLTFDGAAPAAKTISVANTGTGTLAWTASSDVAWLSVSPASGTGNGTVTVTPDASGLAPGTHTGTITISAAGATGSPVSVPVSLTVTAPPELSVIPSALSFDATEGDETVETKAINVANSGGGELDFTATTTVPWLSLDPGDARAPYTISVTPLLDGLDPGTYTGAVEIVAGTTTKTVPVTFTVAAAASCVTPTGLVGAWGFDETTGTSVLDASGTGNAGSIDGATRTASGRFGRALSFDGANDLVTVADDDSLDRTTGLTISAWVNPDQVSGLWRTVVLKERTEAVSYGLYAGTDTAQAGGVVATPHEYSAKAVSALPLGVWSHLATTYDGATLRLYVNGVQVSSRAVTGAAVTGDGDLSIGGNSLWGEWFDGLIDEVRVYDHAQPATAIQADMAAAVTCATTPPKPVLSVTPAGLTFQAVEDGPRPAAQTLAVANTGAGTLEWTASADEAWLEIDPQSGAGDGTISVRPTLDGLDPGTYDAVVTVEAEGADGAPRAIPVSFTVDPKPAALAVSVTSLAFSASEGGSSPAAKTFEVSNTGGGDMDWAVSDDAAWLSVSPTTGLNAGTVTVTPALGSLAAGTHTATITVTAGASARTIAVTFTVAERPAVLAVSPAALSFSTTEGDSSPAAKTLDVSNTGGGAMAWTATDNRAWLSVAPGSGVNAGTIAVSAALGSLTAGTYSAEVTVTAGALTKLIPVTFTVAERAPVLVVAPAALAFSATQGGSSPATKTFAVSNTGGGSMSWTASETAAWLEVSPASGTNGGTMTVTPTLGSLTAGTYTTDVTVTAGAQTKTVAVTFTVTAAQPAGLVAAYGFEETGTTTTDSSNNGNLGTISGATRVTTGKFGNALSFDGVNDWVTVPHASSLNLATGITMSAWVNTEALGTMWRTVLIKEQPGGLIYSLYSSEGNGKPSAHLYMSSGGEVETVGPANTALNQWAHLTSTWDGATLRLYVNGVQVSSRALTGTMRTATGVLRIGGNAVWPEFFRGMIDEVRVYSRALTTAEVQSDMNRPVVG